MSFRPIAAPRGRPADTDCVTVTTSGNRPVLAVMLSYDLATRLGVTGAERIRVEYGAGPDHGKLRICGSTRKDDACVYAYRSGRKTGFNIRQDFLPDVDANLASGAVLPHQWRGKSLVIDFAPLRRSEQNNKHNSSTSLLETEQIA